MSSGGKGNSRANTASTTNNTQTTTNTVDNRVFGEGAITLEGSGNTVNQTMTDFDALRTAGEISADAIALGREGFITGADLAGRGIDTAIGAVRDTSRDAMDFAEFLSGRSLDTVTGLADSYATRTADTTREAFDFADRSLSTVAGLAGDVGTFAKDLVGDTVQGFKDLTMQTSASTDDRVGKVALYAFIAVAAVIVLPQLFKSSS